MPEADKTPFDHWWAVYPGNRKKNKKGCRVKFEAHSLELQREIYVHTKKSITMYPDWRDPQYICAPEVYLNQRMWENALEEPRPNRPASIASSETDERKLHGLKKLQEAAAGAGHPDPAIQEQIDKLLARFGGHVDGGKF